MCVIPGYRSNEFTEGFKAFLNGDSREDCIYSVGYPVKREEWLAGWQYGLDNEDRNQKVCC